MEGDIFKPVRDDVNKLLLDNWTKFFGYRKEQFVRATKRENVPISLMQLAPILMIMCMFFLLDIVVFSLELAF